MRPVEILNRDALRQRTGIDSGYLVRFPWYAVLALCKDERRHDMNKNIMKLVLPAIIAGIGLTNTGCVATRCYETYPATRIETTYVTTPVVETVYVEHPVVRTIHTPPPPPPRPNVAPPRKPAPQPQVKPMAKAKPMPKAKTVAKAKPAPKAKPAQPRQQAKATPRQKPTARPKKRG